MTDLGPAMKALQAKVAEKIIRDNEKRRSHQPKGESLLLNMRSDYKLALMKAAQKEKRSMTNYLLVAGAERMQWEGDI